MAIYNKKILIFYHIKVLGPHTFLSKEDVQAPSLGAKSAPQTAGLLRHQADLPLRLGQLRRSDASLHVRVWPPEAEGLFYVYELLDGLIGGLFPI